MHDCFLSYICGEVGDGAVAFLWRLAGWGCVLVLPYASSSGPHLMKPSGKFTYRDMYRDAIQSDCYLPLKNNHV